MGESSEIGSEDGKKRKGEIERWMKERREMGRKEGRNRGR